MAKKKSKPVAEKVTTVQTLLDELSRISDPTKPLTFGGSDSGLTFNRVKPRGDTVDVEFNQSFEKNEHGEVVVWYGGRPLD